MDKKEYHILFCDPLGDLCPVTNFIEKLKPRPQAKVLHFLSLLQEQGPTLPRPYADILHDGIHEMRITVRGDRVRLLYFFCFESFIILHTVFFKNTDKVPEKHIREMIKFRSHFLSKRTSVQLEEVVL